MFAVIFEVHPKPERYKDYLDLAKMLKPHLEQIDGYLSIDRFKSQSREGWILSLSLWRDEAALVEWRTLAVHHEVQEKGRSEVFQDYRLRVGQVVTDDTPGQAQQRPERRSAYNDTTVHPPTYAAILEVEPEVKEQGGQINLETIIGPSLSKSEGFETMERYDSLSIEGKFLYLTSWKNEAAATIWQERAIQALADPTIASGPKATFRLLVVEMERDYGMFDRKEAPQYYPPVDKK